MISWKLTEAKSRPFRWTITGLDVGNVFVYISIYILFKFCNELPMCLSISKIILRVEKVCCHKTIEVKESQTQEKWRKSFVWPSHNICLKKDQNRVPDVVVLYISYHKHSSVMSIITPALPIMQRDWHGLNRRLRFDRLRQFIRVQNP